MGLVELVQGLTTQPVTIILLLFTAVIAWYLMTVVFAEKKSPEELKAEMAESPARVKIKIQWCGG